MPESSVIETADSATDITITNEKLTSSHESLSEKEQVKWALILEIQKVYQQVGSIRQTARQLKLSWTTIAKYIQLSENLQSKYESRVLINLSLFKSNHTMVSGGKNSSFDS